VLHACCKRTLSGYKKNYWSKELQQVIPMLGGQSTGCAEYIPSGEGAF
jgi:hypothetical protein